LTRNGDLEWNRANLISPRQRKTLRKDAVFLVIVAAVLVGVGIDCLVLNRNVGRTISGAGLFIAAPFVVRHAYNLSRDYRAERCTTSEVLLGDLRPSYYHPLVIVRVCGRRLYGLGARFFRGVEPARLYRVYWAERSGRLLGWEEVSDS
jgi:hypothetical protein